jgi:hypothetical protein
MTQELDHSVLCGVLSELVIARRRHFTKHNDEMVRASVDLCRDYGCSETDLQEALKGKE